MQRRKNRARHVTEDQGLPENVCLHSGFQIASNEIGSSNLSDCPDVGKSHRGCCPRIPMKSAGKILNLEPDEEDLCSVRTGSWLDIIGYSGKRLTAPKDHVRPDFPC